MNEKFFDLKKEKQDRMINAGLKVFAQNGYRHASTDEIVKEAGISKGLLFHYFVSKAGYYAFLYDYITRFTILELTSEIPAEGDSGGGSRSDGAISVSFPVSGVRQARGRSGGAYGPSGAGEKCDGIL